MIIPFFGNIAKTDLTVSGKCSRSGFTLGIAKINISKILPFFSRNHDPNEDGMHLIKTSCYIALALGIVGIFLIKYFAQLPDIYSNSEFASFFLVWFFALSAGLLIFLTTFIGARLLAFWYETEKREWHACEHKCAVLLSKKMHPSVSIFSQCPKTLIGCGTSMILFFLQAAAIAWLMLANNIIVEIPNLYLYAFLSSFSASAILAIITEMRWIPLAIKKFLFIVLLPFAIPFLVLPFLVEHFLALKEPDKEKIRQTIEDLENFIEEYKIYES